MALYGGIWNNAALYCQPGPFQSCKGKRVSLVKCEGSYLICLSAKHWPMPHGLPKMPSLFSQELHPVNIPNHCMEVVAFIITACRKLWFDSLLSEGLIRALGTPLSVVRSPSSSLCDLIWCHTRQEKLSVAHCTPCSISLGFPFNPALPNISQSMGKYFPSKRLRSRGNHGIPLCHMLVNSFCYCWLSLRASCVSSSVVLSTNCLPLWLTVRTATSCFKGISFVNIVTPFSGDMWTKINKAAFYPSMALA